MNSVKILVAYTKNGRIIGSKGKIPWNLRNERRRFKQICNGKKIIMGRKTFEEIGHALSYCTIIIVSKTMKQAPEGCELGELIIQNGLLSVKLQSGEVFSDDLIIAGGEEIYRQSIPFADTIYATEIDADFSGDRIFPPLSDDWTKVEDEKITDDECLYSYVVYKKI